VRPKARKAYHNGGLRHALVEAIASRGIEAFNLRQRAAQAGGTAGARYPHFPNGEELLRAVAEEGFLRLEAALIAARDAMPADPSARLEGARSPPSLTRLEPAARASELEKAISLLDPSGFAPQAIGAARPA
jgi:AcrR family transcriptional regulator